MNKLVPYRKTRTRTHRWSQRGRKCVTFLLLVVVLLSLTAATVNAASPTANASPLVGATTHPIQYAIAGPPSMVDDGSSLAYFKAHGFSIVELVVPDNGTYHAELNTITALGMQPVIDVELVIWNGGQITSPISSFNAYFQSLKNAGWEYVATEGGRSGDAQYIQSLGLQYINYNCDQCGLWKDTYLHANENQWESYYPSEWPYVQNGSIQAAASGIPNGILAGVWANNGGDNQIYTNSLPGSSSTPSYLSMLNWSYANGIGFNQFCVWCGDNSYAFSMYESLEFPQIVANLQTYYPAITALTATASTATAYVNQNFTINGTLSASTGGIGNATITLQRSTNNVTFTNVMTNVTNAAGGYLFSKNESAAGTYYYDTTYAGNATYGNATSNTVSVNVTTTLIPTLSPAVTAQNANSLDVFVRGSDGALWYKYWTGTTWTASTSLGGVLTSAPAATSPANGAMDVFVRGSDNALWWQNTTDNGTTWSGWKGLGGVLGSAPAVTSSGSAMSVFVRGTDGALWWQNTTNSGTTWSGWKSLSGVLGSAPAATSSGSGAMAVFVQGSDNGLWWQNTANSGTTWSGWKSLGGVLASSPGVTSSGNGAMDVFVLGSDNGLWWQNTTNSGTTWSGWTYADGI